MMKKRFVAALLAVMMVLTLVPSAVNAVEKVTSSESYIEYLEQCYAESIKDRSKYCDDVWEEIQQAYQEGRAYYKNLTEETFTDVSEWISIDYETILSGLGKLTWVKSKKELPTVKEKYLTEIQTTYKQYSKSDYNVDNWDLIQDCLYIGKKQIKEATTFRGVVEGYACAMLGMEYASDNEEVQEFREEAIGLLRQYVNLYLDSEDYSKSVWSRIQATYKEAVAALKSAELEREIVALTESYGQKIAEIAGTSYPMDDAAYLAVLEELIRPAMEYYENMSQSLYSDERQEEALYLVWDLEDEIYEAESRAEAKKMVDKTLKKLKKLPTKAEDQKIVQSFVPTVKAKAVSDTVIQISWNTHSQLDGYVIYRATKKNGEYKQIGTAGSGTKKSFKDKKCTFGKTYYYKVRGVKSIDYRNYYTSYSKAVKGTTKLPTPAVTLSKSGKQSVQVKWKASDSAKGYEIYRSNSVNGSFKKVKVITSGKTAKWKDTSTKKGKTYCYKVRSYTKLNGKKVYSSYSPIKKIKR